MFRRYVGPFPLDRKGIDSENAMQGYTERPVGRHRILYLLSLCWLLPIGKGRGTNCTAAWLE